MLLQAVVTGEHDDDDDDDDETNLYFQQVHLNQ